MNNLRYGQIIRIHGESGLIVSKGLTQSSVYYMSYNNLAKITNFRESLFQVLPKGSFEIHDEYYKHPKRGNKELLNQRMLTELNQYNSYVESKLDEEVLFGQEIILKHFDSNFYMVGSYKCSEYSTEAFQVRLTEHPSTQALFRIEPYQSYQKDGQCIYFDEPFILVNAKQQFCLDYIQRPVAKYDDENKFEYIKRVHDVQKYQLIITHNGRSNWRMKLYLSNQQIKDKKVIRTNDLVYLQYSEDNSYFSGENQLIQLYSPQNSGAIPLHAIWELQTLSDPIPQVKGKSKVDVPRASIMTSPVIGYNSITLDSLKQDAQKSRNVVIQQSEPQSTLLKQRNPSQTNQEYILRHFISGKVLTNVEDSPLLKRQTHNSNQYMEIIFATQDQNELSQNCYVQIQQERQVLQKVEYFNQWNESSINSSEEVEKGLSFASKENIQHAFQIKRIPNSIKNNLMYVLSAQEILFEFVMILDKEVEEIWKILNQTYLSTIIECMDRLLDFLLNEIQNRQQCMKETYIIELLMKILIHITEKKLYNIEFKIERKKIKKIFKLTYDLIKKMTANNKELKLHVSKWLEVFLNQAMVIDETKVQESLKELLDDNYEAIQKFITEESINKVIENMITNPHEKYLQILSSVCVCKDRAIVRNQNYILQEVFQSQNIAIQFKFKISNNKVFVYSYVNKSYPNWRTLRQFYNESTEQDNLQSWNYFQSYINLLGDVCYNRNRKAQDFVRDNIPISVFLALLEDSLSQQTKSIEGYLKVIHLAFVNNYNYGIQLVSKIIYYEQPQLQDIQSIVVTQELQNVMQYIKLFISSFTNFGYDFNYNKTLLRVLRILRSSLKLGFWQSINQLISIMHDLLRMCSSEQDFKQDNNIKKNKQRMTKMSPENELIMDCKMLACNIILIILDQENYVRINKMVNIFKEKLNVPQTLEQKSLGSPTNTVLTNVVGYFSNKYQKVQEEQQQVGKSELFKDFARSLSKQKDVSEVQAFKVDDWIQDIKNLLESRDLFKDFPLNIIFVFVEMSMYTNPKMVELSLKLLSKLLGQRRDLQNYFSKIVLLSSNVKKDEIELTGRAIQIRARLERLNDNNVYIVTKDNQSSYNMQLTDVLEDLNSLCPFLKLTEIPSYTSTIYIAFNEFEENDKMHQTLFRALDLHETIVNYIAGADQISEYLQDLLNVCYRFLTLFVWNHAVNKVEIQWPLKQIYQHLQINSYCVDFLRELFHNNKELLYNENEVRKAVRCIIQHMNSLEKDDFYKVKLMDALRVFQYDHNKVIKVNQLLTLSILQEKQNRNLLYLLNTLSPEFALIRETRGDQPMVQSNLWEQNEYTEMIQNYSKSYAKMEETKLLVMDPQLMYQTMFFEIFSILVEDKNTINAEKCRAMHPYASLIALLQHCYLYNCWPLQHFIRSYINRLYYNSDFDTIIQLFIDFELDMILHQLQEIVKLKETKYIKSVQISDGVRFQFLFSYLFSALQEILYSINLVFVNDAFLAELEEQLKKKQFELHVKLFKISACLCQIEKLWFKSSHITRICQVLVNIFKCIFRTLTTEELAKIERIIEGVDPEPGEDPEKQINRLLAFNYLQQDEDERRFSGLEFTLKRMFHLKKKKTSHEIPDDNKELNIKLNKLVKTFNENYDYQMFIEDEFNYLCKQLDFIDDNSNQIYQYPLITLKDFIKNLVQINITHKLNDSQRLFFLKILVRMVSEKNPNINNLEDDESKKAIDEWSPDFWSDSKEEILQIQNFLEECGAASLIYQMFQENFDDNWALFNQLLIFTNAFLLGGNPKCQDALLVLLKQDQTNQMMTNLQQLILKFSKFVLTNFKVHKSKQSKSRQNPYLSIVYLDNLTMFSDQTETLKRTLPSAMESQNSILNKQLSLQVMQRSFRMLQLMCENNNVNMKNYLREQTDKEDVAHLNSINFIEFATRQLRIVLKILNKNVITITSQLVDFINEVIQLPCHLNQSTLCKSTFLEDVCFTFEILHKDESILKLRDLNSDEQEDQLFELQGKIVQSIMLVLEGNDQKSYEELQSKLDPKFLVNFLKSILNKMGVKKVSEINFHSEARFVDEIQQMLNVFIIQEKISQKGSDSKWLRHLQNEFDVNPDLKELQTVCLQNLRKIEIYYEDQLQMVFFPAHPVFEFLSSETRDKIMFNIPRDTQREKLISLLEQMDNIFGEISYNFNLQKWYIPITHRSIQVLINTEQLLSLIINAFMIYAYAVVIKDKQSTLVTDEYEELFLMILSVLDLLVSVLASSFYIISTAPLEFKKLKQIPFSWKKAPKFLWQFVINFFKVFKSEDILSHIGYTSVAIIGTFSNSYYFSLHLFYLFGQLSLLQSVFQAISHNAKQLSLVALLGVLFQFVFSIVGFNNYVDDIYQEEPEDPCHSMISCMITLMTSGVIGSSMSQWDPLKFMYDTVYFVFFALLFTNIISGIMTDTFAQLRDQRRQIDDDKKNNCFICGIDRQQLEKNQEDFDEHIKSKHFLWNYVFYIYCLQNKDSTEYTGLEYWIMEKVENEKTNWFPVQERDQDEMSQEFTNIHKKLDQISETLNKVFEQ